MNTRIAMGFSLLFVFIPIVIGVFASAPAVLVMGVVYLLAGALPVLPVGRNVGGDPLAAEINPPIIALIILGLLGTARFVLHVLP